MKLIKNTIKKLVVVFALTVLMTGCGKSADNNQSEVANIENTIPNISKELEEKPVETIDLQEEKETVVTLADAVVTPEVKTDSETSTEADEPVWIEDELYELAVNELGADKVENVAADAFTVKFLIDEPDEENAWLEQFSILYRMKDKYNLTVKFVFYSEKGNSSSAYLKTEYNAETLKDLDLDSISDFNELKNYVE